MAVPMSMHVPAFLFGEYQELMALRTSAPMGVRRVRMSARRVANA